MNTKPYHYIIKPLTKPSLYEVNIIKNIKKATECKGNFK